MRVLTRKVLVRRVVSTLAISANAYLLISIISIRTWESAAEYLFSVLRFITTGAARNVLLKFEHITNGKVGDRKKAWDGYSLKP